MKKLFALTFFSFLSLISFAQHEFHPSRLIAEIQQDINFESADGKILIRNKQLNELNSKWKLSSISPLVKSNNRNDTKRLVLLSFDQQVDILTAISEYNQSGIFRLIEPDYIGHGAGMNGIVPNDTWYADRQWGLDNDGSFNNEAVLGADIRMEEAWSISTGNSETVIAILDSGLKLDHPEFSNRLWENPGENSTNNIDDDDNGYTDDLNGWDFVNNDKNPTDDHGHGTNVTGIAAATGNNNIGYAGIDWRAKIMTGKILDSNNSGFYSNWISAIFYAVDNGAQVINMSVGGSSFSAFMEDACDYALQQHVPIFVSMMNTNSDTPFYPAAYNSTIGVGATDTNDERVNPFFWSATSGSNFGSHIDLCAPGNFMYGLSHLSNTNYGSFWGGTSQASPLVAGVASLMKGHDPLLTVEDIRTILRNTAVDQVGTSAEDTPGWDQFHGAGRLNAQAALEALNNPASINDPSRDPIFAVNPNPISVDGLISIRSNSDIKQTKIEVYSASGELISIHQHNFSFGEIKINSPSIAGIYFIKISTDTSYIETAKLLVIQK